MLEQPRYHFNQQFTGQKYQRYLDLLNADFPGALDFRVAETPVFVSRDLLKQMQGTCEYIIREVKKEDFLEKTFPAIAADRRVPGKEGRPHFLIFDFGICIDEEKKYTAQLIEMQGFPTLFAYQLEQYKAAEKAYELPTAFSPYMEGYDELKVKKEMNALLKGGDQTDNQFPHTVLLELFPEKQKTRIDFLYTQKHYGIPTVCLTQLKKVGNQLFYNKAGKDIKIDRIYNRLIFDELAGHSEFVQKQAAMLKEPLEITWVTHPNWFYRLSKYTLPFLTDPGIPETRFLSDYESFPEDLENYVLKPLFSFAGNGVIIDVTKADLEAVPKAQRSQFILQKKVNYAAVIQTPDQPAKAEIRLFYIWPEGSDSPKAICNLARLTKGNMVGVAQNKNKTWVGGSFALFG